MENAIKDLLIKYINKEEIVDEHFIKDVCEYLISSLNLVDYIDKIIVCSGSKFGTHYDPKNHTILIDYNTAHNRNLNKFLEDEYKYYFNLRLLESIIHEFEHVRQEKIKKEGKLNIEKKLIILNDCSSIIPKKEEMTFLDTIRTTHKLKACFRYYRKNHDLSPVERIANLKAKSTVLNIVPNLPVFEHSGIKAYTINSNLEFFHQLLLGYKLENHITNSPSLDYLSNMKYSTNKAIISCDYSLKHNNLEYKDRLLYGLSLNEQEYNKTKALKPFK